METGSKRPDRRIQRTRQLLQQAFIEVAGEKEFAAISIQDITERANVNRGTFYAHYPDKYALLETIMREQFQSLLVRTLPPVARWDRQALQLLIQTVLEYYRQIQRECRHSRGLDALIERATHAELKGLLVNWLQQGQSRAVAMQVPVDTVAQMVSWAIFGAAAQWCQQPTLSSEAMARDVLLAIMEGVGHLAPGVL